MIMKVCVFLSYEATLQSYFYYICSFQGKQTATQMQYGWQRGLKKIWTISGFGLVWMKSIDSDLTVYMDA